MTFGLILCAGKQSRFQSETPKALMPVGGETLLAKNLAAMAPYCDRSFVVCSFENEHCFTDCEKIVLHSGKGSGDAVWQALERIAPAAGDRCFVLWGDSLQPPQIFGMLAQRFAGRAVIPCVREEKPYVLVTKNGKGARIFFSKFGEPIGAGLHDQSIFLCEAHVLLQKLRAFRAGILDAEGNYRHKHGNEMEFLDVFNDTDIEADILEIQPLGGFSFNTMEEFARSVGAAKRKKE